jgi:hypothetical protein
MVKKICALVIFSLLIGTNSWADVIQHKKRKLFNPGHSNQYREYVECPLRERDVSCAILVNEYISLTQRDIKIGGNAFHNPLIFDAIHNIKYQEMVLIGAVLPSNGYSPYTYQFLINNLDVVAVSNNVRKNTPFIVLDNITVIEFHLKDSGPHIVIMKNPTIASVYNNYFFASLQNARLVKGNNEKAKN